MDNGSSEHDPVRIALDPGHGYKNNRPTGARANGLIEDDLAYNLVHKIRWYLLQNNKEIKIALTRTDKGLVLLGDRGKKAKHYKANLFLSIHFNAGPSSAHGCEAFVVKGDEPSRIVAERLLDVLVDLGMKNRGVKPDSQSRHSSLRVLRDTYRTMPAVLLEVGFLTNAGDVARIKDQRWFENAAAGLAKAIAGA